MQKASNKADSEIIDPADAVSVYDVSNRIGMLLAILEGLPTLSVIFLGSSSIKSLRKRI